MNVIGQALGLTSSGLVRIAALFSIHSKHDRLRLPQAARSRPLRPGYFGGRFGVCVGGSELGDVAWPALCHCAFEGSAAVIFVGAPLPVFQVAVLVPLQLILTGENFCLCDGFFLGCSA